MNRRAKKKLERLFIIQQNENAYPSTIQRILPPFGTVVLIKFFLNHFIYECL